MTYEYYHFQPYTMFSEKKENANHSVFLRGNSLPESSSFFRKSRT